MTNAIRRLLVSSVALAAIGIGVPATAGAAVSHRSHRLHRATVNHAGNSTSTSTSSAGSAPGGSSETALTGSTLSSASAAALVAVPGGTVDSATTEAEGIGAYEVIVTKTDGTRVKVVEDTSFTVLSTTATTCG